MFVSFSEIIQERTPCAPRENVQFLMLKNCLPVRNADNSTINKQRNLKMDKRLELTFLQKRYISKKHMKRRSMLLVIRKCESKP